MVAVDSLSLCFTSILKDSYVGFRGKQLVSFSTLNIEFQPLLATIVFGGKLACNLIGVSLM